MEARARRDSRSISARVGALCMVLACSSALAAAVDDVGRAVAQIGAQADELAARVSILSELLRTQEAAGEMSPAAHQQNIGAAVSQLRSSPESMPTAMLKRERLAAAQRLIAVAASQVAVARWPTDRPSAYYAQLSRLAMDDARVQLAYLSGLDASLVDASRRAAEVIGWTQGRLGGGSVFDGLDEEVDAVTKAVVTGLPRPPMPSNTVAAVPGTAVSPPTPNPSQKASTPATPATPTTSATPGRVTTTADPTVRGYRVDRCLHWGQQCDEPAATAWCRTQGYQRATNWQWRPTRPTLVIGDNVVCDADYCGAFSTITCTDQPDATQAQAAAPPARPPQAPQPGTQAGVPIHNNPGFGSWQVGMDIYNGADYRSFSIPSADPAICLAECANDARCRAVTYTMPGTYGAAQAACWLKGQMGNFGPHASAISAVKIGATTPGATPPPAVTPPPVATKPPPTAANAQPWLGDWLFRGIAGQRATIRLTSDGVLFLITERNDRGIGRVESATTIVVDFPFANGLRGTLSADGRRINWANGEFWTREASGSVPPVVTLPLAQCDLGGQWRMDTQNVGQSNWTFSPLGGNRYSGQEAGLGNASGTASVNGSSMRLDWRTGGYTGVVELTLDASCNSGRGRHIFYSGRQGSEATTWTRIGASPPPVAKPPPASTPPVAVTPGGLTGQWNGPLGIYEMAQSGNNFSWRVGNEIGQGTISGDNLSVTWTGGGSATGKITARTPQGLPIAIAWSNGVGFRRVGF